MAASHPSAGSATPTPASPAATSMVEVVGATPVPRGGGSGSEGGAGGGATKARAADPAPEPVSLRALFRYADATDGWLMFGGILLGSANGAILPLFSILFGDLMDSLNDEEEMLKNVESIALTFLYLGVGTFIASWMETTLTMMSADRQIKRVREEYLRSLLHQDVGWFDVNPTEEIASRLAEDTITMHNGMGAKIGMLFHNAGSFVGGLIVGFIASWQLTLVMLAFVPGIGAGVWLLKHTTERFEILMKDAYARAGSAATEALSAIRTVAAFSRERTEYRKYVAELGDAERRGVEKGSWFGFSVGITNLFIFASQAVALWYGAERILASREDDPTCRFDFVNRSECFTGGKVVEVFFSVLIGAFSIGQVGPAVSGISAARAAAAKIFRTIDRAPAVVIDDPKGVDVDARQLRGAIEFRNISFSYPSRPNERILDKFSLTVQPGETIALVGGSGSGKSTIIQLLQRFYDPLEGEVFLDGRPIREYRLASLRSSMGVVSQEPHLFNTTIAENIRFGREGMTGPGIPSTTPTGEELAQAAQAANASDFIRALKNGIDTDVGQRGSLLSGGQKQRVAIARAIIRNPRILLLDEATSALDTNSERVVQAALDRLLQDGTQRTTLIVAHRLSTIRHADKIVVLDHGRIVEQGRHEELMEREGGAYRQLYEASLQREGSGGGGAGRGADSGADSALDTDAEGGVAAREKVAVAVAVASGSEGASSAPSTPRGGSGSAVSPVSPHDVPVTMGARARGGVHDALSRSDLGVTPLPGAKPKKGDEKKKTKKTKKTKTKDGAAAGEEVDEDEEVDEEQLEEEARRKLDMARYAPVPFSRVWAYQKEDWPYLVVALLGAAFNGAVMPAFALFFSELLEAFFSPDDALLEEQALELMGILLGLGAGSLLTGWMQYYAFGILGERLTRRLRAVTYARLLRQEIGFFDEKRHSVGRLTSRLAGDAALVRATVGEKLGLLVQNMGALVFGIAIAFSASWRLSLVILAAVPFMMLAGMLEAAVYTGNDDSSKRDQSYEQSGSYAVEALASVRTVQAFGMQTSVLRLFVSALERAMPAATRRANLAGLAFGLSQFLQFAIYALCFWAGGKFMDNGDLDFGNLIKSFFALTFAAYGAGQAASFATDQSKAEPAKRSIFAIIDRPSKIDPVVPGAPLPTPFRGHIEFRNVTFRYPTRPTEAALKNFSIVIEPGETAAFVGPSGSGKSTIIQLLLRFYDPEEGTILVDGQDVRTLDVGQLRARMGLVSQEPILFNQAIAYNIAYGLPPPTSAALAALDEANPESHPELLASLDVPFVGDAAAPYGVRPEVVRAAADANATGFVTEFPRQFLETAGSGGSQLSGGQKQRVAIARALVRTPRVLLLDEATSALDSRSEAVVQAALDRLMHSHAHAFTTLVVAHRLSTIRHADKIVVLERGELREVGTHESLVAIPGGLYQRLASLSGDVGVVATETSPSAAAAAVATATAAAATETATELQ